MKPSFMICILVFLITTSWSQTINIKKLDSLFDVMQNRGLANGSVAISLNGKMVYQRAVGFRRLDDNGKKIAPDNDTKYRIGSVSKMFTAVMILQLIEDGKLSLREKLSAFFPNVPNASKITIEQMLYHRSGLHDYTKDTNFPDWMGKPKTHEDLLLIIESKGSDFEPGTRVDYCNTNYLLLSYIIEKIYNSSYDDVLHKKILTKAGLTSTSYGLAIDLRKNEAASYKYTDGMWRKEKETDMSIHCGAGSLVSAPADLVVFIQNLFSGKLISRQSIDQMTKMIDGYGMGIFPYDFDGAKGYGHNGRIEEFYSAVRYYPGKKLALSYVTNGILYPRTDLMDGIMKIIFNNPYTIPFSKPMNLNDSNLEQYEGTYASRDLPFKVICKEKNNMLLLEAAGKAMEAECINENYFMNLKTGSFFQFDPAKGELQIKETDNVYYLEREKQ